MTIPNRCFVLKRMQAIYYHEKPTPIKLCSSVLLLCPTTYTLQFSKDYPLQLLLRAEKQEMEE